MILGKKERQTERKKERQKERKKRKRNVSLPLWSFRAPVPDLSRAQCFQCVDARKTLNHFF